MSGLGMVGSEVLRLRGLNADLIAVLQALTIDSNRLCDRQLGGTYEEDCRQSIANARAVLARAKEAA